MNFTRRQFAPGCVHGIILVFLLLHCGKVSAQIIEAVNAGPVHVAIGPEYTVVRETLAIEMAATSAVVRFTGFPVEADASSLMLKEQRGDMRLIEWRLPRDPLLVSNLNQTTAGQAVRIEYNAGQKSDRPTLEATIQSRFTGSRKFDLIYRMTGLSWQVTYDVLVRGDLASVTNPMSVDVDGWLEINNQTLKSFSNAQLTVIGPDTLGGSAIRKKEPGILELDDDSPLADLWRFLPVEPKTSRVYPVIPRANLPASQLVSVSLVSVVRKPVERALVLRAEEVPTDSRSSYARPSQIITFQNASDYGGKQAVPPGKALIHLGNQRVSLQQEAWFKHTPADGEIRIDMGKVDGIRARRIDRGRVEVVGGGFEQVYELRIENLLNQRVRVLLDEQPPLGLTWTVIRSNQPYDIRDQRLIYHPYIDPNANLVIQYTVRYQIPKTQ